MNNEHNEFEFDSFTDLNEAAPPEQAQPEAFVEAENFTEPEQESVKEPEHVRKTARFARLRGVIAAVLAIAIVGGGAGFGGAYYAGSRLLPNGNQQIVSADNVPQLALEPIAENVELAAKDTLVAANSSAKKLDATQLFEQVKDTVVGIKLYVNSQSRGRGTQTLIDEGVVGSGVVFTTDGYILTNAHVISEADKIAVMVNDYDDPSIVNEYEATVVGSDTPTDLAILKISRKDAFKAAPIGDSSTLKVGQVVCPIGNPLGMAKSMTQGIISGLNREADEGGYELSSIQIDAAVNPGNSGGPLFDMYGNVVGIVNKKYVYESMVENMGFAITIDEAKPIINDLLTYGEVTSRPVLGITTQQLNAYWATMLDLSIESGLLVTDVNPNAQAYSVLSKGDIITKVNGKDVASVTDVQTQTKGLKSGDTIKVTVVRFDNLGKGNEVEVTVELTNNSQLTIKNS